MANTTNLGLGKLAGTEKLKTFPSMQADNMDTLDTAIGAGFGKNSKPSISQSMKNLGGGMAVLCDNNTHAAIPAGHYAYVMNHGTMTEGLYQNLSGSQIAANATLSGSNLTAVSGGGLNSLYSNLATQSATVTVPTGVTNLFFQCRKSGNIVTLNGALSLSDQISGTNVSVATLPTGFRPSGERDIVVYTTYAGNTGMFHFTVKTDGSVITNVGGSFVSGAMLFSCAFCI